MYVIGAKVALSTYSDLIAATATIHRSLFAELEGDFGLHTTLSTNTEKA